MLGMAFGIVLLGVFGIRVMRAAYGGGRRVRAAQRRIGGRRRVFVEQLEATLKWARATRPIYKAWSGTRPFRVAGIVDEAEGCKSFYLVPVDGRPLPRFEPGQYLTFQLPIDLRQKPLVRCYSLSEHPREDYYRVTIKQVEAPVGKPDIPAGRGSGYFCEQVKLGATLDVQAPQGAFFLDPTNELPVVLVGSGIGITPILSMANSIVHERSPREVFVFAGFGNSREQPFREHLRELASHDKVQVDVSYSRPMPADRLGRDYEHRGRVDVARLREVLPSNNYCFYVCGPPGMMESLVPALREWGVPESHIRFEAFGPASVKGLSRGAGSDKIESEPCAVGFSSTETTCRWSGEYESLLEFAESQGVVLDYGCRAGNCGQCLVSVRHGKVVHVKKPGVPMGENECLTCIGLPQGDVELEA